MQSRVRQQTANDFTVGSQMDGTDRLRSGGAYESRAAHHNARESDTHTAIKGRSLQCQSTATRSNIQCVLVPYIQVHVLTEL